jgi:PAS domain S-box-containing protein
VLNTLAGLGYFVLAKFGFEWGALTANATLLWPPSGLALFVCLVFGYRCIPGLLAAAIAANLFLSLKDSLGFSALSLAIATINGIAAIGQAWIIAHWGRRWYRQGFRVGTGSALYFSLSILLGCSISATLSNLALWQAGVVPLSDALKNWAVWWMGDSIGMLVISPILIWFYERKKWRNNSQANAFLIFCGGIGTVLLAVAAIGHSERETHTKNIAHQASNLQTALQSHIDLTIRDLDTLQEYFFNSTPDRSEFGDLSEPLLRRNPWLEAIGWIPLHLQDKHLQPDLALDFTLARTPAAANAGIVEWRQPNPDLFPPALFAQLDSNPRPSYTAAADETPLINLIEPAYQCSNGKKLGCKIAGLVNSELNLTLLMRAALAKSEKLELDVQLRLPDDTHWYWVANQWQRQEPDRGLASSPLLIAGKRPGLRVMDSEWQLLMSPRDLSIWFLPSPLQLVVLAIGFLLTALLTAYLQALHRQDQLISENQAKLKEEIANQTQALRMANEWLLKEIEAKRNTQDQLKANETHLRTLLDNIPDPIWFKSNEGTYLSFNKAVQQLFMRSENEVIGKTAGDYTDPEFEQSIREFEETVLASREAVRRQIWMHIPQLKQHRLMDTLKVAVRDEQQESIGILSIARDITDHFELVDELEKFKRFAEYASEGLAIMTLSANTLYMNASMNRMLNSNREQESYKEHFAHYYPLDIQQQLRQQIFPQVLATGHWQGELAALHADGTRFPTKETFFLIRDDQGRPLYMGDVMSDISEQKQTEQALQQAKNDAEEATRAKSRFLANMSHEIRTPLNAVLGYSQLLMSDQSLSPLQRERMSSILNSGQRLLHLINDILDLSKIEAGALQVRQDYFDLHQELLDIIALMTAKASGKGLRLEYKIDLPAPAIVKSDRQKIGQIILNLLGNAIKFTPSGKVSLRVHQHERLMHFHIEDTGPGIAAQELKMLFAAFKQGKAGEESGGTGLGLVISKHIAEGLGGDLKLDSEPGKGTQAHLYLPLALETSAQQDVQAQADKVHLVEGARCNALVVEDDAASRDVLVNFLRDTGCEVIAADNGREGLLLASSKALDIVFTDIRMPELSGTEMLKKIREQVAFNQLPIVAVSASSLEHERTFYLGQGFHEFIGKPYQFREIASALLKFVPGKFHQQNAEAPQAAVSEKLHWPDQPELAQLQLQLTNFKSALNSGDMNTSKKQFTYFSAASLGATPYQQIHNALRQYDLVQAEKLVAELLEEIAEAIK